MKDKIHQAVIQAMKAKQQERLDALKLIKAELMNNEKEAKPKDDVDVLMSYRKKLAKSRELLESRPDAVAKLDRELAVIDEFLPRAPSTAELEALVEKHLPLKNFGQIMAAVKQDVQGSFDGKAVSDLIKKKLGS